MKQDYAEAMGVEVASLSDDWREYPDAFLRPTAKVRALAWHDVEDAYWGHVYFVVLHSNRS